MRDKIHGQLNLNMNLNMNLNAPSNRLANQNSSIDRKHKFLNKHLYCGMLCAIFFMLLSPMKARILWVEKSKFLGESGSGHTILMDGPPEGGGENLGIRPMETLLVGMGGCTAYDVVHILKKGRQDVTNCELRLEAERAETDPKIFTKIHITYLVKGRSLSDAAVKRAIDLSAEKYCSASIMLGKTAEITHDYEIIEA